MILPLHRRITASRRRKQSGLTLVELIVAFSILMILTAMAVPTARYQLRRQREHQLLADLKEMRKAIDRYKDLCDAGKVERGNPDANCYPPSLESLVDGVKLTNVIAGAGQSDKIRFLRRINKDPMTNDKEWGKRSMQDEPTSDSFGGQNLFDVYSKSTEKGSDGTPYSQW